MIHLIKQEDMVRYHARNVALWRGEAHDCPVILGSATPAITSYYKAKHGEYHYSSYLIVFLNNPCQR